MTRATHHPTLILSLLALFATACHTASKPEHASAMDDGRELLAAMHARYAGRWYRNLRVTQEVIFHDQDGAPRPQQTWVETISLPGRVRSVIGDEASGNMELYVDGGFHVIRDGRVVQQAQRPHPVLHLGYDVYCQPPDETAVLLEQAGFDLGQVYSTTWTGLDVYVVGAPEGDDTTPQFWVDAEHLLCRRIITRSRRGGPVDIQFTDYARFAGVWLCTELKFYMDGRLFIHEWDVGHELLDEIDADAFRLPAQ